MPEPAVEPLLRRAHRAHQARDLGRAESLYRQILAQSPNDADACNLLGLLCLQTGRPRDAVVFIGRGLAQRPADAQAHYNLGMAHRDLGDLPAAARHFRAAVELDSRYAEALNALGSVLRSQADPAGAASCFRNVLALVRDHAGARSGLSHALNELGVGRNRAGAAVDAIALFQQAVQVMPANAEALLNLGIVLEQAGQLNEAEMALRSAIAVRTDSVPAHFHLAHLRTATSSTADIEAMEALMARPGLSTADRSLLAFGLARVYEKRGDYPREMHYLQQAHAKRSARGFDTSLHAAFVRRLREVFCIELLAQPPGPHDAGAQLVFIVGLPRSGTTLTEQIMASHPHATGVGETGVIATAVRETFRLTGTPYPDCIALLPAAAASSLSRDVAGALARAGGGRRMVVDTTPDNYLHVGFIAWLLPHSRIVHCRRHPLDTCLSIYQHPLSDAHAYSHDFGQLATVYRQHELLAAHWRHVLAERILELRYESTVVALEPSVRTLLDFCGLPFDPGCLAFHLTKRVVRTPSASQVRQPVYAGSVGRWRRYEASLAPLRSLLAAEIAAYESA